jgi:hypothetical protein
MKKIKAVKVHVAYMRRMKMMSGKKVRVKLRPRRKGHSSLAPNTPLSHLQLYMVTTTFKPSSRY